MLLFFMAETPSQVKYIVLVCDESLSIRDRDELSRLIDEELKDVAELIPLSETERENGSAPRIRIDNRRVDESAYKNPIQRLHEIGYCVEARDGGNVPKFLPPLEPGSATRNLGRTAAYYQHIQGFKPPIRRY